VAYIESHQTLGNHPKTKRAARELGIGRVQLVGHMHYLWWWALEYAEDGDLSGFSDDEIAEEAMWEGDPAAFVGALTDAGFLDPNRSLHDWEVYTGRLVAQRESNRERQRRFRERRKADDGAETGDDPVTVTPRVERVTVTSPLRNGATETLDNAATVPKRTVPNRTEPENGANAPTASPPSAEPTPIRSDRSTRTDGEVYALVDAFAEGKGIERSDVAGRYRQAAYRALSQAPPGIGPPEVRGCTAYLMTDPFWEPPGKLKPDKVVETLPEWLRKGRPSSVHAATTAPVAGRAVRNGKDIGYTNEQLDAMLQRGRQ
jgi:hypothetical protein